MSATFLPSNLIVPNEKLLNNPNWVQTEAGTPVSSVFTESVQDRLLVAIGRHPSSYIQNYQSLADQGLVDAASQEVTAIFRIQDLSLQQLTGFQLESVTLTIPFSGNGGSPSSRNLVDNLCGDYVDDAFAEQRRFSPLATDMTIPLVVAGTTYSFNMANYLPYGQSVAYYNLGDVITYFLNAWTNFMHNQLGDASFYATVYVDNVSPRIFWSSTTYSLGQIRLLLSDVKYPGVPSFLSALKNHLFFLDTRTNDTSQTAQGYPTGESMGILPRRQTGIQNNMMCMTIHSQELTQFRKSDSMAPADGPTIIGTVTCPSKSGSEEESGVSAFYASTRTGGLISPKIAFDKTQTLTEFSVYLRAVDATGSVPVQLSQTELRQMSILLVFRCW